MIRDLSELRENYDKYTLEESDLCDSPFDQFKLWFDHANNDKEIPEANAMLLSTVSKDNIPHSRVVLLKQWSDSGFVFYTNYNSQKAIDISHNSGVALNFTWLLHHRQIRINGQVEKISRAQSDAYFQSRPRSSKLGAWSSSQSELLSNRSIIEDNYKALEEKYHDKEIPTPKHWGGFKVIPNRIEFWQGRASRLHDRIVYTDNEGEWAWHRLNP